MFTKTFGSLWFKLGNFIEKHPKITLCLLALGIAGTGSTAGLLLGPMGFFFGTFGTAMAMKKTDGSIKKLCPEFYQDPTNNCEELDFKKYLRSIKHFAKGGGTTTSLFPLEPWACKEFEESCKKTNPDPDSTVSCRSTGELECMCEIHYKKSPKPKTNMM
ncbi:MAG: hypothetical protein PVI75_01605 [Gammaproteobacteria bacterium]|jgi:hypothetical protein